MVVLILYMNFKHDKNRNKTINIMIFVCGKLLQNSNKNGKTNQKQVH
jgi:hypothetical protein